MTMIQSKKRIVLVILLSVLVLLVLITAAQASMIFHTVTAGAYTADISLPRFLKLQQTADGSYEILQGGKIVGAIRCISAPDIDIENSRDLSQYMKAFYGQENGSFWSFQGGEDQRIYDVDYATGETRADFCYSKVCAVGETDLILFDLYADLIGIEWFRRSILGSVAASDIPKT